MPSADFEPGGKGLAGSLPFVISIPHASGRVPDELSGDLALSPRDVKETADQGTSELFGGLPALALVEAQWSRLAADLNRSPADFGPKGVVALVDYHDRPIFKPGREPGPERIAELVEKYHQPYHESLRRALGSNRAAGLIDCHSLDGKGPAGAPDAGSFRPDVVLGNAGEPGTAKGREVTCPAAVMGLAKSAFERAGLSAQFNLPYSGGYITRHYGAILRRQGAWAMQIEVNKGLFLNLSGEIINKRLGRLRDKITQALTDFAGKL